MIINFIRNVDIMRNKIKKKRNSSKIFFLLPFSTRIDYLQSVDLKLFIFVISKIRYNNKKF